MGRNTITILVVLFVFWGSACNKNSTKPEEKKFDVPYENLVAFTAEFSNTGEGWDKRRIVLADYYDPTNFIFVHDNDIDGLEPVFSCDKTRLLFGDAGAIVHGHQFVLYDIKTKKLEALWDTHHKLELPCSGFIAVWNAGNSGFYFSQPPKPFSIEQNIHFYDFNTKTINLVHYGKGYSVYPRALKGQDTLIVFSNNSVETGQNIGYYFMDLNGNYLSRITNPNLDLINKNGITKKGAYHLNWNDDIKLFVFSEVDSTLSGYKISITDLRGNYYKTYTSGQYIDEHPVFGPDSKTVLFDRHELQEQTAPYKKSRLMILNVETGKVEEYVKPEKIGGAYSLRFPDF